MIYELVCFSLLIVIYPIVFIIYYKYNVQNTEIENIKTEIKTIKEELKSMSITINGNNSILENKLNS